MGYRLSIYYISDNGDEAWVGEDHKFYGYCSFSDATKSFGYLRRFILDQIDLYKDYLNAPSDIEELFYSFNLGSQTDRITLSPLEFEEFSKLYLEDLEKFYGHRMEYVREYIDKLLAIPGPKQISWG